MFFGVSAFLFWAVLSIVFLVAELLTTGLFSIWFCIGSLASMLSARAGATVVIQLVVFAIVSAALLVLTKPFVKKVLKMKTEATNADRIIGQKAVVVEKIDGHNSTGAVRADGKIWTAKCEDIDRVIEPESEVEIVRIEGVKVVVK